MKKKVDQQTKTKLKTNLKKEIENCNNDGGPVPFVKGI